MSKKILIYTGDNTYHVIFERMTAEIVNGFMSCGYYTIVSVMTDQGTLNRGYEAILDDEVYFSFGFNWMGVNIFDETGHNLYENSELLHFSYMMDAPYNPTLGKIDWPCKHQIFSFMDKTHSVMLGMKCPEKANKKTMFLPMAGISNFTEDEVFSRKRKYDVVVCANLWGGKEPERVWRKCPISKEMMKILDESADLLTACPISIYQAVQHVLMSYQYSEENIQILFPYFTDLFKYVKCKRRIKSMEFLLKNGVRPIVFGEGWEWVPFVDKLDLKGLIGFEEMLEVFSQSKIIYQDMAEFNNGANDRGFNAMLNGAVVVSEYSAYLEEEYNDGEEIFFYDWQNGEKQVSVVNELLENEKKREKVSHAAYKKTTKRHRWCNRAMEIIAAADNYYSRI